MSVDKKSNSGAVAPASSRKVESTSPTKKIALAAVLVAVTVVLSPIHFYIGSSKCFPAQHMVNGIAGVLLGPWLRWVFPTHDALYCLTVNVFHTYL